MKALRYLLIVAMVSVASMVFATAQSLAQKPEAQMTSTSGMVYSGSTLPSAAAEGTVLTGTTIGTYSSAETTSSNGPRKVKQGWGGEGEPGDRPEPYEDPLGDAMIPLMLLAGAYLIMRAMRKRMHA